MFNEGEGVIAGWMIKLAVVLALCVVIFTIIILAFKPVFLGFERKAFKQSHQYVEGHETALLMWVDEYNENETEIAKYEAAEGDFSQVIAGLESQQTSQLARIHTEAAKMPSGTVPESVETFLALHPK